MKTNDKKRKCLACGKVHHGKSCPIVAEKLGQCITSNNKNFLLGNIFLECIKTQNDFIQILYEISEELIETREFISSHLILSKREFIPSDLLTEYFATSLKCHSSKFFKKSSITSKEFGKLLGNDWYVCDADISFNDDRESIDYIEIPVSISGSDFKFCIRKEHESDKKWSYNLYLKISDPNFDIMFYGIYHGISSDEILLLKEYNGEIKNYFEKEFDSMWSLDDMIIEYPCTDPLFDFWMKKLEISTKCQLLEWNRYSNNYETNYKYTDIFINVSQDDVGSLYVRCGDGDTGIKFQDNNTLFNSRILNLANIINQNIINPRTIPNYNNLPQKEILHSDIIVTTKSIVFHNEAHNIIPLRGFVKLLTKENQEKTYEVYVGYCKQCDKYYMFDRDFKDMIKIGRPLCQVVPDKKGFLNFNSQFNYKDQSVLKSIGYTVDTSINLSAKQRQDILKNALDEKLLTVHDIINFLNWLIITRKSQDKYIDAINKWTEDLKFIEDYNKSSRNSININKIISK